MKKVIQPDFQKERHPIEGLIENFDQGGKDLVKADRNRLKKFDLNGTPVIVKSFKIPNWVNKIAYRFLRKSKAQRSYEYALALQDKKIGTPRPVAFFEFNTPLTFRESYYICEYLEYDLTFRELVHGPDYPDHEEMLRAFTRFSFQLHEKQVLFKDHSPGNTLIKKEEGGYAFYLVDLNRMAFKTLSFEERMKNLSHLTPKKEMVEIMSDEYAQLSGLPFKKVFSQMWYETENFQEKFHRKKRLKKKLKFWKR